MEPIIHYQGELFQGLRAVALGLAPFTGKLWVASSLTWLTLLCRTAFGPFRLFGEKLSDQKHWISRWWLALLLAGFFLLRLPLLGLPEQNVDEGQWVVSAGTLIADPRFWISVDGTTSGPLNVYPLTLPWLFGMSIDYATIRLVGLLSLVLTLAFVFKTFVNFFGMQWARVAILPMAVALTYMRQGDGAAYNSEHFPMLLLAAVGWLRSVASRHGERWWRIALTGFLLGCIPYTKLQAVPLGIVLAGGVFLQLLTSPHSRRWLFVSLFSFAGLLPSVIVGIYLWQTDNVEFFYKSFILANLGYAEHGSFGNGVQTWSGKLFRLMPTVFLLIPSTVAVFMALPFVVLAALYGLWKRLIPQKEVAEENTTTNYQTMLLFSLLWVATAFYSVLKPGNNFPHYQILSYVPVFWLAGLALILTYRWLRADWQKRLLTVWLVWLVVLPGVGLSLMKHKGIEHLLVETPRHDGGLTEAIARYAKPNDRMMVWGWDNKLHVWTGLLMASRFIPLYYPVVPSELQPYFMQIHEQDLLRNRPAIVVDATQQYHVYHRFMPERYPFIRNLLATEYRFIGTMGGYRLFVRKDRVAQIGLR